MRKFRAPAYIMLAKKASPGRGDAFNCMSYLFFLHFRAVESCVDTYVELAELGRIAFEADYHA